MKLLQLLGASPPLPPSSSYDIWNLKFVPALLGRRRVRATAQSALRVAPVIFRRRSFPAGAAPLASRVGTHVSPMSQFSTLVADFRVASVERAAKYACAACHVVGHPHALEKHHHRRGVLHPPCLQSARVAMIYNSRSELSLGDFHVDSSYNSFARILRWGQVRRHPERAFAEPNLLHSGVSVCVFLVRGAHHKNVLNTIGTHCVLFDFGRSQGRCHGQGLLKAYSTDLVDIQAIPWSDNDTKSIPRQWRDPRSNSDASYRVARCSSAAAVPPSTACIFTVLSRRICPPALAGPAAICHLPSRVACLFLRNLFSFHNFHPGFEAPHVRE